MNPSIWNFPYDELPTPYRVWPGGPSGCEECLGMLSLLTPERVLRTSSTEIKTGETVTLAWDLPTWKIPRIGGSMSQLLISHYGKKVLNSC